MPSAHTSHQQHPERQAHFAAAIHEIAHKNMLPSATACRLHAGEDAHVLHIFEPLSSSKTSNMNRIVRTVFKLATARGPIPIQRFDNLSLKDIKNQINVSTIAAFLAAVQAQIISLSYQDNSSRALIAANVIGFGGVLLDVMAACQATTTSAILQREVAEREVAESEAAKTDTRGQSQEATAVDIEKGQARANVAEHAHQTDEEIAGPRRTELDSSPASGALPEWRLRQLLQQADSTTNMMIIGIYCIIASIQCLAIGTQPKGVWITSAVVGLRSMDVARDDGPNCQPEAELNPPARPVSPIPFDSTQAQKREVDAAELVGKTFVNAYQISPKPDDEGTGLPGSFGIAFTDGSRYHIRIKLGSQSSYVDTDIDEDDFAGKRITAASLLRCEGHFHEYDGFIGLKNDGMMKYIALGVKLEGSDEWVKFFGTEEDYNSDGDGLTLRGPDEEDSVREAFLFPVMYHPTQCSISANFLPIATVW
ncbi:hypothetical protein NLJ89_g3689 [Agrocybe chaxingu]|uniref:Uncharacterized protein n=1 Tax=Agrocybe chaxingu TaxID=84603 RepID=A0A9W8K455_9AGAR|nr:hypothetical protein NLJ89_g3689 [Agrocybe chaxingu]